ncbi:Oidioi.mRNA.OKI2018_I69.PAR.g8626.t1.cds [Oikopleura dioica]|uniref:Oidioi.mRNA.OKI2018_I69.PAR.g8626.t1.cds n=1 Tax=Oikopleura dioica TaxID=34765 RepID=A0ABN7RPA8_OIKDI|nr:Oidioi.mRNA.OKI2018_I69.PAR.g8626.t1.cds [Oikopleura dioica]
MGGKKCHDFCFCKDCKPKWNYQTYRIRSNHTATIASDDQCRFKQRVTERLSRNSSSSDVLQKQVRSFAPVGLAMKKWKKKISK